MYLYSYQSTHGISGLPAGGAWEQFEVHLKMTTKWTQRYSLRPWLSEFGDALGGRDGASLEMHSGFVIDSVWRCTWRPWSSEFGDTLGGRDRVRLGRVLGGGQWTARWVLRLYSSVSQPGTVGMWQCDCTWELSWRAWLLAVDRVERHAGSWSHIQGSTHNHETEGKTNNLGWMLYSVYAILGVCSSQCMQYSVSTHDNGMERDDLPLWSAMMVELWTRKREMRDENENDMEDTSGYVISGVQLAWLGWEDLGLVLLHARSGLVPAILGMVNWLSHEILLSPSCWWWFPPISSHLPLSRPQLYHHLRT